MQPGNLARTKLLNHLKPIAVISFVSALIAVAANSGEVSETDALKTPVATYTGHKVCAECHQENFEMHAKHGHAATFFKVAETDLPQVFDGKTFDAGEDYGIYSYQKDESGNLAATIRDGDKSQSLLLQFALGSGHHAQTFLSLQADSDGATVGIEHRVSCYSGERLGVTVGHEKHSAATSAEMFGAVTEIDVLERCVYCHTTTAKVENGQVLNLTPHVSCEKCHGPGSEHVRLARKDTTPPPYSVGLETWDRESEIQLCGDCHRLPRSISQQELREYPDTLARFQPVGMLRSKCYLKSDQGLKCSTCHDPHASNFSKLQKADHVKTCINCHDQAESTHVVCPVSPTDNCINCHMPPVNQSQGIKFHDHWIRVRDR